MLQNSYLLAVEAATKPHHHLVMLFGIFMALCLVMIVLGFLLHTFSARPLSTSGEEA